MGKLYLENADASKTLVLDLILNLNLIATRAKRVFAEGEVSNRVR